MKKFSVVLELETKLEIGVIAVSEAGAQSMILDYFKDRLPNQQLPALQYEGELPDGTPGGLTIRPIR